MPIFEFECPRGHVTDQLVPVRDAAVKTWPCPACLATAKSMDDIWLAKRILSPTVTNFRFNDRRGR